MTEKFNTGNAVPSSAREDLHDNALALDEVVNSTEPTFVDRLGNTRKTFAALELETAQTASDVAQTVSANVAARLFHTQATEIAEAGVANLTEEISANHTQAQLLLASLRLALPKQRKSLSLKASAYTSNSLIMINSAGETFVRGVNVDAALGQGYEDNGFSTRWMRVHLPAGELAVDATVGYRAGVVLTASGKIFAWGRTQFGEFGADTAVDFSLPKQLIDDVVVSYQLLSTDDATPYSRLFIQVGNELFFAGHETKGDCGNSLADNNTDVFTKIHDDFQSFKASSGQLLVILNNDGNLEISGNQHKGQVGSGSDENVGVIGFVETPLTGHVITDYQVGSEYDKFLGLSHGNVAYLTEQDSLYMTGFNERGACNTGDFENLLEFTLVRDDVHRFWMSDTKANLVIAQLTDNTFKAWGTLSPFRDGGEINYSAFQISLDIDPMILKDIVITGDTDNLSVFFLYTDGSVSSVGFNGQGNLGQGIAAVRSIEIAPVLLPEPITALDYSGKKGDITYFATGVSGASYVWGYNGSGIAGGYESIDLHVPQPLEI